MKLVGVVAILLGGVVLVGCGGGSGAGAKAPVNRDLFELAQEELSHTIGTTTIASAEVPRAKEPSPPRLDDEPSSPPMQTWGAGASSGDHDTAASDLAANPYTTADAPRDIYDPR